MWLKIESSQKGEAGTDFMAHFCLPPTQRPLWRAVALLSTIAMWVTARGFQEEGQQKTGVRGNRGVERSCSHRKMCAVAFPCWGLSVTGSSEAWLYSAACWHLYWECLVFSLVLVCFSAVWSDHQRWPPRPSQVVLSRNLYFLHSVLEATEFLAYIMRMTCIITFIGFVGLFFFFFQDEVFRNTSSWKCFHCLSFAF